MVTFHSYVFLFIQSASSQVQLHDLLVYVLEHSAVGLVCIFGVLIFQLAQKWYRKCFERKRYPRVCLSVACRCLLIIAKATLLLNNVHKYLLYRYKEGGRTQRKHTWLESRATLCCGTQI